MSDAPVCDVCKTPYRLAGTENYYEQVCDCGIPKCAACGHPRRCGEVSHEMLGQPPYTVGRPCPCCGNERTRLTHAAIRFRGKVYSLPAPARHHDVIRKIVAETGTDCVDGDEEDQGFLDEGGAYLNRRQALVSAELCDQLKPGTIVRAGQLSSEDVW